MFRLISKPLMVVLVFSLTGADELAGRPSTEIRPGPTSISDEEHAITEDPAAGVEHAVILVEETERDEDIGAEMETRFHRRVKILSNQGRDLANIEIPFDPRTDRLKEWWGRTLLPDGTVLDISQSLPYTLAQITSLDERAVEGHLAFLSYAARLHRVAGPAFIYADPPTWRSFSRIPLRDALQIDVWRTTEGALRRRRRFWRP